MKPQKKVTNQRASEYDISIAIFFLCCHNTRTPVTALSGTVARIKIEHAR
jgi:hypothetical protein